MKSKTGAHLEVQPRYLRREELGRLLAAAKERGVRDHLLLALSYRLGLRVSEAVGLQVGDLDLVHKEIAVRGLKGGTARRYTLARDLLPLLRRWIKERGTEAGALFCGRQGDRITPQRAWQIMKACAEAAGLPTRKTDDGVHFHTLRHSVAVHMLDSAMPLETVKDLLRHRSIRSSEVYATMSQERRGGYQAEMERSDKIVKVRS